MSTWTPEREAEIRARCDAATEGPWRYRPYPTCVIAAPHEEVADIQAGNDDAAFIAHARQDLPDALAEIERLRALLAEALAQAKAIDDATLDCGCAYRMLLVLEDD